MPAWAKALLGIAGALLLLFLSTGVGVTLRADAKHSDGIAAHGERLSSLEAKEESNLRDHMRILESLGRIEDALIKGK